MTFKVTSHACRWATIAGITALCRLMILPITIGQVRNTYRLTVRSSLRLLQVAHSMSVLLIATLCRAASPPRHGAIKDMV